MKHKIAFCPKCENLLRYTREAQGYLRRICFCGFSQRMDKDGTVIPPPQVPRKNNINSQAKYPPVQITTNG